MNKAIILAAGLGTRMRPLTDNLPKPLVEVAGKALIDWVLDGAVEGGVSVAVVNTSYKAEMLEAHIARRNAPSLLISRESEPLETGGGIANALPLLGDEPFFSLNSDTICLPHYTHYLQRLRQAWDETKMDALLLLHPREKAIGFHEAGDFFIADGGSVKRRGDAKAAPYVFTGTQLIHPRLFESAPQGKFSINTLYDRDLTRIHALIHDGHWLHVGDLPGLAAAEAWFAKRAET